jgi:hypothetical protein
MPAAAALAARIVHASCRLRGRRSQPYFPCQIPELQLMLQPISEGEPNAAMIAIVCLAHVPGKVDTGFSEKNMRHSKKRRAQPAPFERDAL